MAQTTMSGSFVRSRNISVVRSEYVDPSMGGGLLVDGGTLLAGFAFSLSKIFWDCTLVAVMLTGRQLRCVREGEL